LCADDFTCNARGRLGGLAGIFYSGAMKRPVKGFNIEVLCAVIGDGQEVILLDIGIVPPTPEGGGRRPLKPNEWLRLSLKRLGVFLSSRDTKLDGCALSVDAANVSPQNIALVKEMKMDLVSKLAANRLVVGNVDSEFSAKAGVFAQCALFCRQKELRTLRGESLEYQRKAVTVPSLKTKVLMVPFVHKNDFMTYFSTNLSMKAITLRNILRYRWQLERIFWILKQDIGIGDIHHHSENRMEARIYLHFILAQTVRNVAGACQCSPKDVIRGIRRSPERVLHKLGFPPAFASVNSPVTVPEVRQAA
jgi:hypothetical protein